MESKIVFAEVWYHLVVTVHVNTTLLQKLPSTSQVSLILFHLQCLSLKFNRYYRFWAYIYVDYQHLAFCPTSLLRGKLQCPLCKKCTSLFKPVLSQAWGTAHSLLLTANKCLLKQRPRLICVPTGFLFLILPLFGKQMQCCPQ